MALYPFPKTEGERRIYWKAFDRKRWNYIRWGTGLTRSALSNQVLPVITSLHQHGTDSTLASLHMIISEKPMYNMFNNLYLGVGSYYAEETLRGLSGKSMKLDDRWAQTIRNWIATHAGKRIKKITQTTLERTQFVLSQGIKEGLSIDDMASLISGSGNIMTVNRATVIARTEIISASNMGSIEGARSTGLPMKKLWISTKDQKTREDHVYADGQTTNDLNSDFNVGGENLAYPGDPVGSAGNVINCRCAVGYQPY